jgi:outer membrane protein TolC
LMYGERQGQNMNGSQRADFVSAKFSMDIPIFRRQRQHAQLNASESMLTQMQQQRVTHLRDLRKLAATELAVWRRQNARMKIFQRQIKEAEQYAQSTLKAYENAQTDFPNVARAYVSKLNTELFAEDARFKRVVARINLLYLQSK